MGTLRDRIANVLLDTMIETELTVGEFKRIADAILVACCIPPDTPDDAFIKPLRELRMWHWREAMKARHHERRFEQEAVDKLAAGFTDRGYTVKRARAGVVRYKRSADFHIKAVQALNDVVPGTAEKDCET